MKSLLWPHVFSQLKGKYGNSVLKFVSLILCLPASSADAERGFNQLKLLKTDWRSRLTDVRASHQLCIMLNSPAINKFIPSAAIDLWNASGQRGKNLKDIKKTEFESNSDSSQYSEEASDS